MNSTPGLLGFGSARRAPHPVLVGLFLLLLVVGAGCSTLGEADGSESSSQAIGDGDGYQARPRAALDLGTGVVFDAPATWQIRSPLTSSASSATCNVQAATVEAEADFTDIEFLLVGAGCTDGHAGVNGSIPDFVGVDIVPEALDVVEQKVALGELTLFTEPYAECGGECVSYQRRVALLEMTKPPERDFPTLVIYTTPGAVGTQAASDATPSDEPRSGNILSDEELLAMVEGISLDQP